MARVFAAMFAGAVLVAGFSACVSGEGSKESSPSPFSASDPSERERTPGTAIRATDLVATAATKQWLQRVEHWAAADRGLSAILAPNEDAFAEGREPGAFESLAHRAQARASALFVTARARATSPLELSLARSGELGLKLARLGVRQVNGQLDRGRLIFVDAFPSTDVVVAVSETRAEELLVLKDGQAPRSFSWRVTLTAGLAGFEKQADGSLLARAIEGAATLRILAPRLLDSTGRARTLEQSYENEQLRIDVDASGLTYPLLLDPMIETVVWEPLAAAGGSARDAHAAARLASGGIVYGGETLGGVLSSTLLYNAGTKKWDASASTTPGPLRGHAMAYNGTNAVLFGGTTGSAAQNKTWLWSGADWVDGCSGGCVPPTARQGAAMAFAGGGKLVLFGGTAGSDETWEYAGGAWSKKCGGCDAGTSKPSGRLFPAIAYAGGTSALLFGGTVGDDETWSWNGTDWSKKCAACVSNVSKPSGRNRHAMAWDENRKRVVLFGGVSGGGQRLDDTWEWDADNDEWVPTASSGPSGRSLTAMFYDVTSKRMVLFGGETDAATPEVGDTYEYHARGGDCASVADCNTGFCKDGKCCETACTADCRTCAGSSYGLCENVGSANGTEDADTCADTEACNAGGVCKLKKGEGCSGGTECLSTFCTDGHCCETACNGACKSCNNAQGTCSNIAKLSTDNAPACSGNNACDGSGACKEANGQNCSSASECASGFCVDGRCCESSCTDSCKSCSNAAGTCTTNVAKGATDTNANPACSGNNACDGAGTCKKANGQSCGSDETQCASGFCADSKCCDTACNGACNECSDGSCSDMSAGSPGSPSCAPYACNGSSATCPTTCANDNSCAADHYCKQGACVPDEIVGAACDRDKQCPQNQNCVDGVCCNADCKGACMACSNAKKGAGADGACDVIVDGGTPRAPGCPKGATVCLQDGKCDGNGECRAHAPKTTPCGAGTVCVDNSVSGQLCDGEGSCMAAGGTESCGAALCVNGACNNDCNTNDDCHETGFCAGSVCDSKRNDGLSCGGNDECKNGHCVDGVCCNNACEGACQKCELGKGSCELREEDEAGSPSCAPFVCDGISPVCPDSCTNDDVCVDTYFCKVSDNLCVPREHGTPCTDDDQCPDPFCVDGVCCAEACDGQCEHCDSTGVCVATTGAPLGGRDACPGHADCAGSCDGSDRTQCTGEKPAGSGCGTPSCSANIATVGACKADASCEETSTDCDPYVCGDDACKTSCAKDVDCKSGFSCVEEACVPSAGGGVCDETGTKLTTPDDTVTDCTPFICRGGECLRNCTSSTDCQPGFACNTSQGDGVCESLTTAKHSDEDAGCSCRAAGATPPSHYGYGVALLGAALLLRRRRPAA